MFELAVLAGVLIALARRVDLNSLASLRFRGLWFCFVAFGLKVALFALGASGSSLVVRYGVWLQFAVTLTLLALVVANLRLRGMPVVLVGLLCNLLVILLNGAKMPVTAAALAASGQPGVVGILQRHEDPGHTLVDSQTRLAVLGDWIPLAALNHKVVSLGDIVAAAGLTLTVGFAAPAGRRNLTRARWTRADPPLNRGG